LGEIASRSQIGFSLFRRAVVTIPLVLLLGILSGRLAGSGYDNSWFAVLRKPAGELPVKFTLDDSLAMAPTMKLSNFDRVVVNARVSKSGNATPQPGDFHGTSATVANSASGVTVVIDQEVR